MISTQVIGQTEKALNAILGRQLAGTGLTEPQWVTLTLTVVSGGTADRDQLTARVADVLKVDPAQAGEHIAALAAAGLVYVDGAAGVTATDEGRALWTRIRGTIGEITESLWGDLPAEDLDTAGRVLNTVLDRANALLTPA